MNTQSEDNYLVLICIFRLRRSKKNKKTPASRGVFVVWLQNKGPPLLPARLPHERAAPTLTDPEIWLLNCFWPNFCFPRLCRSRSFCFSHIRVHVCVWCFCLRQCLQSTNGFRRRAREVEIVCHLDKQRKPSVNACPCNAVRHSVNIWRINAQCWCPTR